MVCLTVWRISLPSARHPSFLPFPPWFVRSNTSLKEEEGGGGKRAERRKKNRGWNGDVASFLLPFLMVWRGTARVGENMDPEIRG